MRFKTKNMSIDLSEKCISYSHRGDVHIVTIYASRLTSYRRYGSMISIKVDRLFQACRLMLIRSVYTVL